MSSEILSYAAIASVLVGLALLLTSLLARWLVARKLRRRFPPLPFMDSPAWRSYGRGWWGRLKARLRRWWRK